VGYKKNDYEVCHPMEIKLYIVYMNEDLILYYKERAKEYEQIYAKPDRQDPGSS
jgi:hypothetical protein